MLNESVTPEKKKTTHKKQHQKKGPSTMVMIWDVAKMRVQDMSWGAPPSWGVLPSVVGCAKEERCRGGFSKESSRLESQVFNGGDVLVPLSERAISYSSAGRRHR